jgi:hypothetical protein
MFRSKDIFKGIACVLVMCVIISLVIPIGDTGAKVLSQPGELFKGGFAVGI